MLVIFALTLPLHSYNVTAITGILRAGGDVKVTALIDNVPLMALLALVLDAPVWLVCLARYSEAPFKLPLTILRFRSKKWINDVTQATKQS